MQTQTILFDLDDTLIYCSNYFIWTREKFLNYILELFHGYPIKREVVSDTQKQVDVASIEAKGLGKDRFPESLVETYRLMCAKYGKPVKKEEELNVFELGHSVYEYEVKLYPHALSTLKNLIDKGHDLYLYTGGDYSIQTQKVYDAGLDRFFPENKRFVYEHKNTLVLKQILRQRKFNEQKTWMIGNSARTDIRPALELGMHAIYIPDQFGWEYDHVELNIPAKGHFLKLESIQAVPSVIEESIQGDREKRENLG